jgi:hypothetical protein
VSGSLKEKDRWLQCTIRNTTEFSILSIASSFDSGRYEDHPGFVDAFSLGVFTCCEGDGTFMTGVSGGQSYQIDIDGQHSFQFSIVCLIPSQRLSLLEIAELNLIKRAGLHKSLCWNVQGWCCGVGKCNGWVQQCFPEWRIY